MGSIFLIAIILYDYLKKIQRAVFKYCMHQKQSISLAATTTQNIYLRVFIYNCFFTRMLYKVFMKYYQYFIPFNQNLPRQNPNCGIYLGT